MGPGFRIFTGVLLSDSIATKSIFRELDQEVRRVTTKSGFRIGRQSAGIFILTVTTMNNLGDIFFWKMADFPHKVEIFKLYIEEIAHKPFFVDIYGGSFGHFLLSLQYYSSYSISGFDR